MFVCLKEMNDSEGKISSYRIYPSLHTMADRKTQKNT